MWGLKTNAASAGEQAVTAVLQAGRYKYCFKGLSDLNTHGAWQAVHYIQDGHCRDKLGRNVGGYASLDAVLCFQRVHRCSGHSPTVVGVQWPICMLRSLWFAPM